MQKAENDMAFVLVKGYAKEEKLQLNLRRISRCN